MKARTALLLGLLAGAGQAQADFYSSYLKDPEDGMLDASQYLSQVPLGFLPVPAPITEPAVGTGLAVMGIFFHESAEQKEQRLTAAGGNPVLPKNISVVGFGATNNGSKGGGLGHLGFWKDDSLRYKGFLLYSDFNLDFYSLGNLNLDRPVELNISGPLLLQQLTWRVPDSNWFVGGRQLYRHVDASLAGGENAPTLANPVLNERLQAFLNSDLDRKITTSGLGLLLEYDSRNNPMGPTLGYDYTLQYTRFDSAFGSDVEYDEYHAEGLNYWALSKQFDLALRMQYDAVDAGDSQRLPPYVMPAVDLRGVSATRYQGEQVATAEVELTYKLNRRWKFNTFTGVARAADSIGDMGSASSITNLGVGFRYLIASRYGFWMGSDVARGPEETAFYIQAGSVW
ncbi:MAG: BamA/TamA family outer membrane protein [Halopseudomonas sp.]|uniref:BamA/TamA family outer membrane protein n=1 Tax=Halopseudomonas sp. TaxID=2901191 RepID=UPI0030031FAF